MLQLVFLVFSHSTTVSGHALRGSLLVSSFRPNADESFSGTPTSFQVNNSLEVVASHWASTLLPSAACLSSVWNSSNFNVHVVFFLTQHELSVGCDTTG